ncbi:hypothetical protein [Paenibacillus apiarius]
MPHNKAERIHQQQNKASQKEESITLKPAKAGARPPSLNRIPKQEG